MSELQHNTPTVIPGGKRGERQRELDFERLYRESYSIIYGYVRCRMPDEASTEDIVSEAYLKAARAFSTYDPSRAKFSTWVGKIASNCMKDYWRREHPATPIDDAPEQFLALDDETDLVGDRALIKSLLAVLDDTERQIVLMKYLLGYRNTDIAQELDMNASTVSTKLATALAKMRTAAEEQGE